MKKKNGIIVLIVVLSVAVIVGVGYKIADKFYAPLVQTKAVSYLCHKYDAKPDEFEMVDYNQAHITLDEYEIFFLKPRWVDFSFEYVYNGRHFFVTKNNGHFCDDYQLIDIENWGTEWLKNNIDKRIVGFRINSLDMIDSFNSEKIPYIYENDIELFLKNYLSTNDGKKSVIYFYDESLEIYNSEESCDLIDKKLSNKLGIVKENYSSLVSENNMEYNFEKSREYSWTIFCK